PPSRAKVLNANGIIRVAGHFFQYTRQYIKIIEGGDERQIPKLLTATQDDRVAKIRVFPLTAGNSTARTGNFTVNCFTCIDKLNYTWGNATVEYAEMYGNVIGQEYSYPIYGAPQLVCPTDDGGTPLQGPDSEPYCYYAQFIVGYGINSILRIDFFARRSLKEWWMTWFDYPTFYRRRTVSGSYSINGIVQPYWIQLHNVANISQTLYDGSYADFSGVLFFEDYFTFPGTYVVTDSCPGDNRTPDRKRYHTCRVDF
ncbi:MAG TPA: hypothetical protein DCM08_03165, partial [Microscillaceae bacterium]|nr:hypothetical protein [Microscillaceae bacterium]